MRFLQEQNWQPHVIERFHSKSLSFLATVPGNSDRVQLKQAGLGHATQIYFKAINSMARRLSAQQSAAGPSPMDENLRLPSRSSRLATLLGPIHASEQATTSRGSQGKLPAKGWLFTLCVHRSKALRALRGNPTTSTSWLASLNVDGLAQPGRWQLLLSYGYDVLCLQETHLTATKQQLLSSNASLQCLWGAPVTTSSRCGVGAVVNPKKFANVSPMTSVSNIGKTDEPKQLFSIDMTAARTSIARRGRKKLQQPNGTSVNFSEPCPVTRPREHLFADTS